MTPTTGRASADDLLHDLVGAAVDRLHACVAPDPGDLVLASCSRSRRAAARSGRRPRSAGRWSTTSPRRVAGGQLAAQVRAARTGRRRSARPWSPSPARRARSGCPGSEPIGWPNACRLLGVVERQVEHRLAAPRRRRPRSTAAPAAGSPSGARSRGPPRRAGSPPAPGRRRRTARPCPAPSCPILSRLRPRSKPGMPRSTTSRLSPRRPPRPGRSARRRSRGRRGSRW